MKRLDSSTSLFQRQTSLLTKKVSNLANKLVNPFVTIKKKIEQPLSTTTTTVDSQIDLRTNMKRQISVVDDDTTTMLRRTVTISPLKRAREDDEELNERRKVQVLSVNQEIRRPTGLFSYEEEEEEEPKRNGKKWKIDVRARNQPNISLITAAKNVNVYCRYQTGEILSNTAVYGRAHLRGAQ